MRVSCILFVALAACGDPLVGPAFVGTPELSVGGVVMQLSNRIPAMHGELALSVFWIRTASSSASAIEQEALLDSGLAEYSMTLFDAPPAQAAGFSDLLSGNPLAIGVIALYADKDQNSALDLETDLLLGASAQHLLVYAGAPVASGSAAFELLGSIDAGYHVYQHDRTSACRFVDRASCQAEGALVRAADPRAVSLSLWGTAEEVLVPAPSLMRNGAQESIWAAPQ